MYFPIAKNYSDYRIVAVVREHVDRLISFACWNIENNTGCYSERTNPNRYLPPTVEFEIKKILEKERCMPGSQVPGFMYSPWLYKVNTIIRYEDGVFSELNRLGFEIEEPKERQHENRSKRQPNSYYLENSNIEKLVEPFHMERWMYGYDELLILPRTKK
jgi:hypothetical protein